MVEATNAWGSDKKTRQVKIMPIALASDGSLVGRGRAFSPAQLGR